jgi:hypothetical protein
MADDFIYPDRDGAQCLDHALAIVVFGRRCRGKVRRLLERNGQRQRLSDQRRDLLDDIALRLPGSRLPSAARWCRRRAGRAVNPAPRRPAAHLSGKSGADQRSGTLGSLDYNQSERQARNDPVAARKILGPWLPAKAFRKSRRHRARRFHRKGRYFRADKAGRDHRPAPLLCRWRSHPDGRRCRCRAKSGDDGIAVTPEIHGEDARHLDACERSVAGADDCDRRNREDGGRTLHRDQRWRMIHAPQEWRIVGLADCDEAGVVFSGRLQIGFCLLYRRNSDKSRRAARHHQFRQHFECGLGGTEAIDQVAEGCRSDIFRSDQPKPADPLPVAEAGVLQRPSCRSSL